MKSQIFNFFDLLLASPLLSGPQTAWQPAADVYRCQHGWLVKFELAGVHKNEIEIRIKGSNVVVSGTRRDWRIYEGQEAHLMEIAYSHFERTVDLSEEITEAEIRSEYRDGMLLVHVLAKQEVRQ